MANCGKRNAPLVHGGVDDIAMCALCRVELFGVVKPELLGTRQAQPFIVQNSFSGIGAEYRFVCVSVDFVVVNPDYGRKR